MNLAVLILNVDLPIFPGRAGHEHLNTTRLARLARKVGLVSLVHTCEQQENTHQLTEAGIALYVWEKSNPAQMPERHLPRPSLIRRVAKALFEFARAGLDRPRDTLIQDCQFRNVSGAVLQALDDEAWQAMVVIQSNCARWLDYIPPFPASVLVLHDVRARVYARQAHIANSMQERLRLQFEASRYRRFEREYCGKFDLVVTVSSEDEAWVREHYRPPRLVTVPIPVDGDYFAPMLGVREAPARILFTGMMNHPPNVDAACYFAHEVLPRVQAAIPEAEFWIVGRDPAHQVRILTTLPGVVVTGFVKDIRPFAAQATVVVVPLRFGSGMRNKILEAWGMRKCVVSTRIGAEGLDYRDGENILIADDAQTMAEKVIQAIHGPHLRDRIRTKGRELITTQHHPDKLAHQYYQAIASVVREKQQQDEPMKVAIDLRWMRPGVAGGIENLSRSFINHLLRLDAFNRYTILSLAETKYDFDLRGHSNFQVVVADGPGSDRQQLLWRGARFLFHRFKVDYWHSPEVETLRQARALDAQIALSIPGYIHPDLYPLANVLMVPDIQHEYCPEFFSSQELEERRRVYAAAVRRADHICAISEFTRQTLIERMGVPPERVTTTRLAADPIFAQSRYRENPAPVLERYRLSQSEYLFYPSNTWPHKNHRAAFEALRILREAHHLSLQLVCTGAPKEAHPELLKAIQDLRLDGHVRFLGYCPTPDMPALYKGAAALVFPSFFEGFGIPLLEAMWCDCPIVCSGVTGLPETAGDAALLIDPRSPEQLAEAIRQILTDTELRHRLVERGRQQVKKYSWHNFTIKTVQILRQVHDMRYG